MRLTMIVMTCVIAATAFAIGGNGDQNGLERSKRSPAFQLDNKAEAAYLYKLYNCIKKSPLSKKPEFLKIEANIGKCSKEIPKSRIKRQRRRGYNNYYNRYNNYNGGGFNNQNTNSNTGLLAGLGNLFSGNNALFNSIFSSLVTASLLPIIQSFIPADMPMADEGGLGSESLVVCLLDQLDASRPELSYLMLNRFNQYRLQRALACAEN